MPRLLEDTVKNRYKILFLAPLLSIGCGANLDSAVTVPGAAAPPPAAAALQPHPELPSRLVQDLRTHYPNLEVDFIKAICSLNGKYPGLVFSLPRHLIQDLNGEPLVALKDVAQAETARYPNLLKRVRELRRTEGPRHATAQYIAAHYPTLVTSFLQTVDNGQPLPGRIRMDVDNVVGQQFPQLSKQVALSIAQEAQDNFPSLSQELANRNTDQGPLRWLADNHQDYLVAALSRVVGQQGPQLRQASVATLSALEQDAAAQPAPRVLKILDFLSANFPTLLRELVDQNMAARQKMVADLRREFPDAQSIAATTLLTQHPLLLTQAQASLQNNYPQLLGDAKQALENQMPGFVQEVYTFLQTNYPDVAAKLPAL